MLDYLLFANDDIIDPEPFLQHPKCLFINVIVVSIIKGIINSFDLNIYQILFSSRVVASILVVWNLIQQVNLQHWFSLINTKYDLLNFILDCCIAKISTSNENKYGEMALAVCRLSIYGAVIAQSLHTAVTHILINREESEYLDELKVCIWSRISIQIKLFHWKHIFYCAINSTASENCAAKILIAPKRG